MSLTLEQQIKSLDLKQNAIKILINSFYGAFGNRYFYFHNNDIAQSITLQGQDLIKFTIKAINHYFRNRWHLDTELHEKLGLVGHVVQPIESDSAIYTDTDSVYSCIEYAIKSVQGIEMDDTKALEICLAINKYRLDDYFKAAFEKYANHFHTKNRLVFELENVSRAGILVAKKKYVFEVATKGSKILDKPVLMIKGLEAIQSSYPIWARENLKKIYWILLDKGYDLDLEKDLIPVMQEMKNEMDTMPIDSIAFNFNVRVYEEHVKSLNPLIIGTGMPIYGRAAAYHNHVITKTENQKYAMIRGGSKIKFYYCDPNNNDYDFDVFAYVPGVFPDFAVPTDREQQFFRLIVEPINKLLLAMGFSEINSKLTRHVEMVRSRSRAKNPKREDLYPLYVVNSETLEFEEIPETVQDFVGNPEAQIPDDLFPTFISVISLYGLSTVIVPKPELQKYRERIAKKKGIEVEDPFAIHYDEMAKVLRENGWETSWSDDNWVKSKAKNKEANTGISTKSAYSRVMKILAKKVTVFSEAELEEMKEAGEIN